jgi:hypothetical protein
MSWKAVGVIEPGFFWQEFGDPILGSTVIRVSHTYDQQPNGPALIRMNWFDGYFGTRKIYPSQGKRILEIKIPSPLIEQGIVVGYLAVRVGYRTRPHENDNWRILVEELAGIGSTDPSKKVNEQLDELLTDTERIEQKLDQQATNNPALNDQIPNNNVDTP